MTVAEAERQVELFRQNFEAVRHEVAKLIVGQDEILEAILTSLLADGHVLLEGIPGLGKTKLVQTLAQALHLHFSRIQFTPDLMPGDIVGTNVLEETEGGERELVFRPGPVFTHLLLADEINRATPKTQSALLEAMQEKTVSVGRTTHPLQPPFFVLATQNPLEMEGTYPLPEAQLDRFFFKLKMTYPGAEELRTILDRTTQVSEPQIDSVLDRQQILDMRQVARSVPIAQPVQDYAIRLVMATHPGGDKAHPSCTRFVRFGASPRGAQALVLGAKVRALLHDRAHVAASDIRAVALPALRHRLLLNFEAEAQRIDTDDLLQEILAATLEPGN